MNYRLKGMIRKEFFHILRDRQTLIIILSLPVLMLLLYGYAISLDLKDVNTRIIDYDQTRTSREFVNNFEASSFFMTQMVGPESFTEIASDMRRYNVKLFIVIPKNFNRLIEGGKSPSVKLYIDASDPNTANQIQFYASAFAARFSRTGTPILIDLESRFLYNQNLDPPFFFVPGLVAFIMIMLSAMLTAITISRERESGTMEQLLVSPLKPREIILGKTVPYLIVAMIAEIFIIIFGIILFELPFRGNIILLFILSIFFLTASLAIGLLASVTSRSQQVAMFKAMLLTLLPTLFLSGFIFPLESMHFLFQWVSNVIPAKYFITIIRGIMLKGNTIYILIGSITGLLIISVILMRASIAKFKIHLEN